MEKSKVRRRRGVLLTSQGLKRLQAAISVMEIAQNNGERFTLAELSDRVKVSNKTLSRLWSLNTSVDQKTLKLCFSALNLELCEEDYSLVSELDDAREAFSLEADDETGTLQVKKDFHFNKAIDQYQTICIYPDGPVPLDSPLYIEHPLIENLAYQEITQPGCIIRIRAPKGMGKSSIVLRLLNFAQQQNYHTVKLDCEQLDSFSLHDLNQFLRCFCRQIAKELGIEPNLEANWDEEIGSKLSCSFYLKNYLLEQIRNPIVLVLEQVECLFEHSQLAREFFSLLRSWYEEGRRDTNWQKLRLVVVHCTEVYVSLDINRSPFNIGLPLHLPEFTQQQVQELAQRHGLNWNSGQEVRKLMFLIGGHPALVRIALYHLCCQGITLNELSAEALANGGIYRHHLWQYWIILQDKPALMQAYTQLVKSDQSILLSPIEASKLHSLGLVAYEGERLIPRCQLYRAYFQKQLSILH
jgi:transcriptional regulator with XRE-family HTH domain